MVYRGKVKGGKVILDSPGGLPEGAEVLVEPAPTGDSRWERCVGSISEDEAHKMLEAIEESCERLDAEPPQ